MKVEKTGSRDSRHEIVLAPRIERKTVALAERKQLWIASYDLPLGDWEVEYKSGGQLCQGPEPLQNVHCSEGFFAKDGNCTKEAISTCGIVEVDQVAGHTGSTNGVLQISVSRTDTTPQLLLAPINANQLLTVTDYKYSRSTPASASCREQGHSLIASATECETAARMLKLKVTILSMVHTSDARPAGCFLYTGAKPSKLEFNTDAAPSKWTGGWSDIFTICRQTSGGSSDPAFRTEDHELKSGAWRLEYRSGDSICNDSIPLNKLVCKNGYALDKFGRCSYVNGTKNFCELLDIPGIAHTGTKIFANTTLNITFNKEKEDQHVEFKRFLERQAEIRLVPAIAAKKTMQAITHFPLKKTGNYSVQIEYKDESSVESSVCQLRKDIQVICPETQERDESSGACMDKCEDQKVRTKEGACDLPAVKASIESDGLELKLEKLDPHLNMNRLSPKTIQVAPKGGYELKFSQTPYSLIAQDSKSGEMINWVKLGAQANNSFPIEFVTSDIKDGSTLNATLTFSATLANSVRAVPVADSKVELFAVVECVPSLEKSTMTINGQAGSSVKITQGQEVVIKIRAKDHEDQLIEESRGRYMDVMWRVPGCDSTKCPPRYTHVPSPALLD